MNIAQRQKLTKKIIIAFTILWVEIYLLKFLFPISVKIQEFNLNQSSQIEVTKNKRNQFNALNILQANEKISFNCDYLSQNLCERFFKQNTQILQGKYLKISPQTESIFFPSDETSWVLIGKFSDKNGQVIDYQTSTNSVNIDKAIKNLQNYRFSTLLFLSFLVILFLGNIFKAFQK